MQLIPGSHASPHAQQQCPPICCGLVVVVVGSWHVFPNPSPRLKKAWHACRGRRAGRQVGGGGRDRTGGLIPLPAFSCSSMTFSLPTTTCHHTFPTPASIFPGWWMVVLGGASLPHPPPPHTPPHTPTPVPCLPLPPLPPYIPTHTVRWFVVGWDSSPCLPAHMPTYLRQVCFCIPSFTAHLPTPTSLLYNYLCAVYFSCFSFHAFGRNKDIYHFQSRWQ